MEAADTGKVRDPLLVAIAQAQQINRLAGGALVAPWEVSQLPDEWLEAFRETDEIPRRRQEKARLEQIFEAARQQHPQFGKY